MTREAYVQALIEGYGFPHEDGSITGDADQLIALAESLPVGTVIEIRGDVITTRGVHDQPKTGV